MSALDVQVGGGHYKDMAIQPAEFITRNKIGFLEGCVIKRVCRWRSKDGVQDLRKAMHELELLIEMEETDRRVAEIEAETAQREATIDDPLGTGMHVLPCNHPRQQPSPMEAPFGHVYQCVDCGARTVR